MLPQAQAAAKRQGKNVPVAKLIRAGWHLLIALKKETDKGVAGQFSPPIALILTDFTDRIGGNLTHLLGEQINLFNLFKIIPISGCHLAF